MTVTVAASAHHRAAASAEQIARMFAEGHDLTTVTHQGAVNGWTRMRALEVVSQRGWTLDDSGRVPRHQRPAVTPGKPVPSAPAGMPGVGTIGGQRPAVAEPKPSPGRAQIAVLAGGVTNLPPDLPALTAMATAAQQREADSADALLARAAASRHPDVVVAAAKARLALDALRHALDVLAAAEAERLARQAALGKIDVEAARLRTRLAELDVERGRLLADTPTLPADTPPPPAAPATAPHGGPAPAGHTPPTKAATAAGEIDHGTWGGFLKHRYRGERACEACDAAREQTMAARSAARAAKAAR